MYCTDMYVDQKLCMCKKPEEVQPITQLMYILKSVNETRKGYFRTGCFQYESHMGIHDIAFCLWILLTMTRRMSVVRRSSVSRRVHCMYDSIVSIYD